MPTSSDPNLSRRLLMAMALTLPWSPAFGADVSATGGIVSLDSGLASTLLSLGVTPAAITSRADWNKWVADPPMPDSVADLGTISEINLEILARLKPDRILSTPLLAALRPRLETIAPVAEFSIYAQGHDAVQSSFEATRDLARLIDRGGQGEEFLQHAENVFADCRRRLGNVAAPPVGLITLMDERHARVYGAPGLFQGVLDRLGLVNAWPAKTNFWGFQTIALEELISLPAETHLMIFEPLIPADILRRLGDNPLWRELPFVRSGRVSVVPAVLMFGMVREAIRFSRLLTDRLEKAA